MQHRSCGGCLLALIVCRSSAAFQHAASLGWRCIHPQPMPAASRCDGAGGALSGARVVTGPALVLRGAIWLPQSWPPGQMLRTPGSTGHCRHTAAARQLRSVGGGALGRGGASDAARRRSPRSWRVAGVPPVRPAFLGPGRPRRVGVHVSPVVFARRPWVAALAPSSLRAQTGRLVPPYGAGPRLEAVRVWCLLHSAAGSHPIRGRTSLRLRLKAPQSQPGRGFQSTLRRGRSAVRVCRRFYASQRALRRSRRASEARREAALDVRGRGAHLLGCRLARCRAAVHPHHPNNMPAPSYIPARDADFEAWLLNFTTLLTAAPATYGLTAPDAVTCAAQYTAWSPAYIAATDPSTRTPVTVAAKDAARVTAEAVVRPFAQAISRNAAVDPGDKVAIGVNLPNFAPVPFPPPTTFPQLSFRSAEPLVHILQWQDSGLGTGKKKPVGAIGCELYRVVASVPAVDPLQAVYLATFTKSPLRSTFQAGQVGDLCTYFARWVTRSGPGGVAQAGPWSAPLTVAVI